MNKIVLIGLTLLSSFLSFAQEAKEEVVYKDTTGKILTDVQLEEIVKKGNISMRKGGGGRWKKGNIHLFYFKRRY